MEERKMLYEDMKKKYPGKEIKLIPAEFEPEYLSWGFTRIGATTMPAFGKKFDYYFMVEEDKDAIQQE